MVFCSYYRIDNYFNLKMITTEINCKNMTCMITVFTDFIHELSE